MSNSTIIEEEGIIYVMLPPLSTITTPIPPHTLDYNISSNIIDKANISKTIYHSVRISNSNNKEVEATISRKLLNLLTCRRRYLMVFLIW